MIYTTCVALLLLILAADFAVPLGVAMGVPYVLVVLISLWAPNKKFTYAVAVVASLFTLAAFFLKPPVPETWKVISNRGLALFVIWVTASLGLVRKGIEEKLEHTLLQRDNALQRIQILSGLITICASCKKICDDHGYWTKIEDYISSRSEADFTHGICPECAVRLYPRYRERLESGDI